MSKNDGGPAFPYSALAPDEKSGQLVHSIYEDSHGMSLRDWFAGQAGQEAERLLDNYYGDDWRGEGLDKAITLLAETKGKIADAMLKEREK